MKMLFRDKVYIIINVLIIFIVKSNTSAQVKLDSTWVDTTTVIKGLVVPWEILWGPDNYIWITERNGIVSRANPETGEKHELVNITEAYNNGEGGLLGMALHPEFNIHPHVFLVYSYLAGGTRYVRLVRYNYTGSVLNSPTVLIDSIPGAWNHLGSRLVIGPYNKLFMTTGDAADTDLPQNLNSLNGKILRLNLDGSIPDDNPFSENYTYTWGHRNAQGLVIAPNSKMYSSEHGPSDNDELNIIEEGRNYGWPNVHGFCDDVSETGFCADNNVKVPLTAWTPTLAVCGLDYYHHDIIPEWRECLLLTSLKERDLRSFNMNAAGDSVIQEKVWFNNYWGRLRDLCVSPDGRVFIAVSNRDGRGDAYLNEGVDDRIIEIKALNPKKMYCEKTRNIAICENDSALLGGKYQKTTGTYYDTLEHDFCDTVIVSHLEAGEYIVINKNYKICHGDSIQIKGKYYAKEITITDTVKVLNTCDSIIINSVAYHEKTETGLPHEINLTRDENIDITVNNGFEDIQWNHGPAYNSNTFSVQGNSYTIGVHILYFKANDQNGCIVFDSVKLNIKQPATNLNAIGETQLGYNIFPNPAFHIVHIESLVKKEILEVGISDFSGRQIIRYTIHENIQTVTIPVDQLPAGLYFISIKDVTGIKTYKVCKR